MSFDDLKECIKGIHIFAITPFKMTGDDIPPVDYEGVKRNARFFAAVEGERVITVCGGTGEFHSLTEAENRKIVEAAASEAKGKSPLISGIGGNTEAAIKMAKAAQEAGSDVVLIMPCEEIITKGEDAIFQHHAAIAEAVDIGLMPYRNRNSLFSIDLILRFLEIPNVVALKDESGDINWFRDMIVATEERLPGIIGGEMLAPYYYLAGASGITTGVACLVPHISLEQYRAAAKGDYRGALRIRDKLAPITKFRGKTGNTMLKAGLEMMGLAGGPIRDTKAVMNDEDRKILRKLLVELGALS
ncbi:dihydrodipicolinate synthase family protein [Candidatus Poribacteria bacterium]|nr:dihydrodipicolinate synthase family protein [Candidatus Poribacteria bacterium]